MTFILNELETEADMVGDETAIKKYLSELIKRGEELTPMAKEIGETAREVYGRLFQ